MGRCCKSPEGVRQSSGRIGVAAVAAATSTPIPYDAHVCTASFTYLNYGSRFAFVAHWARPRRWRRHPCRRSLAPARVRGKQQTLGIIGADLVFNYILNVQFVPTHLQVLCKAHKVAVLPGDGIGPEIMDAALKVLTTAGKAEGEEFEFTRALIGGAAIDATGSPLPDETLAVCRASDSVLLAAIGGCDQQRRLANACITPVCRCCPASYSNQRVACCFTFDRQIAARSMQQPSTQDRESAPCVYMMAQKTARTTCTCVPIDRAHVSARFKACIRHCTTPQLQVGHTAR